MPGRILPRCLSAVLRGAKCRAGRSPPQASLRWRPGGFDRFPGLLCLGVASSISANASTRCDHNNHKRENRYRSFYRRWRQTALQLRRRRRQQTEDDYESTTEPLVVKPRLSPESRGFRTPSTTRLCRSPHSRSSPRIACFRGLLNVHSHYGLHTRRATNETLYTEGFGRPSLRDCSDCYRLERQLPGGVRTHWKTVPLHGALQVSIGDAPKWFGGYENIAIDDQMIRLLEEMELNFEPQRF
jgi:hypothetical protein